MYDLYNITDIMGIVSRPQAKNSKNITTSAWCTLGSPIPELCQKQKRNSNYINSQKVNNYYNNSEYVLVIYINIIIYIKLCLVNLAKWVINGRQAIVIKY